MWEVGVVSIAGFATEALWHIKVFLYRKQVSQLQCQSSQTHVSVQRVEGKSVGICRVKLLCTVRRECAAVWTIPAF